MTAPRMLVALTALCLGAAPVADAQGRSPRLVSTTELAERLGREEMVVIDVRQAWSSYLESHLEGAVWLHIETLRAAQDGLPFQLLGGAEYARLFGRLGVRPGLPVVVYSAGDQLNIDATFVAWLLASAGASDVSLLDGGYAKWELEGRPVTQRYPRFRSTAEFGGAAFRPEVAGLEEVMAAVKGSGAMLVDARPTEQYTGVAGAQARRGHIPGAVSHPWKNDLEKPDFALVWKPVAALREAYAAEGIVPERDIIVYCNSGTEASHVHFALRFLLGYPRVRIFPGSWTQWAEREELPVER